LQKKINRRGFLLSGAAVGVGAITSRAANLKLVSDPDNSGGSESGVASTLTDGVERSLVVIPSSDLRFEDMVNEHFPALIGDRTFQALKGVSVVLHNKQGPAIHAHKLLWTFTLGSGPYSTEISTFWRPRPAKVHPVEFCKRSANRPVLKQGAVGLVSPFFSLASGESPRQTPIDWEKVIQREALQEFLSHSLPKIQQTSVITRSAVYGDYTVLDTDKGNFAERLTKIRNTEARLAKAVLEKLNEGIPDPRLLGAFNRTYDSPSRFETREQAIVIWARKNHAKYLRDVLLDKGRDKLLELVSRQAQQQLTSFRRLVASS
jgi:hypothetical protein